MIKVIVFDFDDTLKKSEHLKEQGFTKIFLDLPRAMGIAAKYVSENKGAPRYQMIQGILLALKKAKILEFADIESITAEYVKKFGDILEREVIAAKDIPGASTSLELLYKKYRLYINTVTPDDAIKKIIPALGWQKYFIGLYGCPPGTKLEHLQEIINKEKVTPDEVVVVGDGASDLKIAKECGTHFIGIKGDYNKWPATINFPILNDLKNLSAEISKL